MARLKRPIYSTDSSGSAAASAPQAPALDPEHIAAQAPAAVLAAAREVRASTIIAAAAPENSGDIDVPPCSSSPLAVTADSAVADPPAGVAGSPAAPVAVQRSASAQALIVQCDTHRITLKPLPIEIRSSLTAQQLAYCLRYVETASRKQAYLDAGYSPDSSESAIYAVHQSARVQACIAHILAEVAAEAETNDEWIDRQLIRLYREAMEPTKIYDKSGVYTGMLTPDRSNALKALELIGKKRGLFGSKVQHEHSGSVSLLLQAVAARGKPSLAQRQGNSVTVDNSTGEVIESKGNPT